MHAFAQPHISVLSQCKRQAICNVICVMHNQSDYINVRLVALYALVSGCDKACLLRFGSCSHLCVCVCPAESSHHTRMVLRQPSAAGTTSEFDH